MTPEDLAREVVAELTDGVPPILVRGSVALKLAQAVLDQSAKLARLEALIADAPRWHSLGCIQNKLEYTTTCTCDVDEWLERARR